MARPDLLGPLLGLLALAALTAGVVLVGPAAYQPRFHDDYVALSVRVAPQGAPASPIDRAPSPAEAIGVWAALGDSYQMIAGDDHIRRARFDVLEGGRRFAVETETVTRWHLPDGPARRVRAPGEVPVGENVHGFQGARYVAKSVRVTEGQDLWVIGFRRPDGSLMATEIADDAQRAVLGSDLVPRPFAHLGALALFVLGAALLGQAAGARGGAGAAV